jgi:pimeloyl-ACP methyl ester carboxylesterase
MDSGLILISDNFTFSMPVMLKELPPIFVAGDENAHRIDITCYRDGAPADLSGLQCEGYIVNGNRQPFLLAGTISGNVASVVLGEEAYYASGPALLMVRLYKVGYKETIFYASTTVNDGVIGEVYNLSTFIPDLEDVLAQFVAMQEATAACDTAAANAAPVIANFLEREDLNYLWILWGTSNEIINGSGGIETPGEGEYRVSGKYAILAGDYLFFSGGVYPWVAVYDTSDDSFLGELGAGYPCAAAAAEMYFRVCWEAAALPQKVIINQNPAIAATDEYAFYDRNLLAILISADISGLNSTGKARAYDDYDAASGSPPSFPVVSYYQQILTDLVQNQSFFFFRLETPTGEILSFDTEVLFGNDKGVSDASVLIGKANNCVLARYSGSGAADAHVYVYCYLTNIKDSLGADYTDGAMRVAQVNFFNTELDPDTVYEIMAAGNNIIDLTRKVQLLAQNAVATINERVSSKADKLPLQYGYLSAPFTADDWEQGAIHYDYGVNLDDEPYYSQALRLIPYFTGAEIQIAIAKTGYIIEDVFKYDLALENYLGHTTVSGPMYSGFEAGYNYRITLCKSGYGTITPDEWMNMLLFGDALELSADVPGLALKADKAALAYGYAGIAFHAETDWEQGAIDYTYGVNLNDEPFYSQVLRLIPFIDGNVDVAVAKAGYMFDAVFKYNPDDSFVGVLEIASPYYDGFEAGYKYRITLVNVGYGTITPDKWVNALLLSQTLGLSSKLPYQSGDIRFSVSVNQAFDDTTGTAATIQDSETPGNVSCLLRLPDTYTADGAPTRLVLAAHGLGWWIAGTGTGSMGDFDNLLAAGYALFDVNGSSDNDAAAWGCPRSIQAIHKAYKHILENYNVEPLIYASGVSMGGITALNFANTFPQLVKAVGVFCPTTNQKTVNIGETPYQGVWEQDQENFAAQFGFAVASVWEEDRVRGYNPFTTRTYQDYAGNDCILFPVPIKIWHGLADPSIPYQISQEYATRVKRSGVDCRLRLLTDVPHTATDVMKAELLYWYNRFS